LKVYGEYKILPSLKLNSDFSYDLCRKQRTTERENTPFMATDGSVFASSVNNETYVYSNYLTFDKNLGENIP
jgi:hypothetical protein